MIVTAYTGLPSCYYNAPAEDKRPAKSVSEMFDRLVKDIDERMVLLHTTNKPDLLKLKKLIGSPEAIEFCRQTAKKYKVEQRSVRETKANEYKNKAMAQKPPTVKQLKYLKELGCTTRPGNQYEASVLIAKAKSGVKM